MTDVQLVTTQRQMTVSIQATVKMEDITSFMGKAYGELFGFIQSKRLTIAGPPIAYYSSWNDKEFDVVCAFPVSAPFHPEGMFKAFEMPSVKAAVATHEGPYQTLVETYGAVEKWIKDQGMTPAKYMWEEYLDDPAQVGPDHLHTRVFWPIA